jgi:acetylglutamate kinase
MSSLVRRATVIKFGGHALDALAPFARAVVRAASSGLAPVIVHGGGPQIDAMLTRLQVPSAGRHQGLRITSPDVMEVAQLVLRGQVGPAIVAAINAAGGSAVGLAGHDGRLMSAAQRDPALGLVGDVIGVRPGVIETLLSSGHIPVVAPIAPNAQGVAHNINADAVAAAIAVALHARTLVMLTDVPGLYERWPDQHSLISRISADELEALLPHLEAGMIPKMGACLEAVRSGVAAAHVLDGRDESWVAALTGKSTAAGTIVHDGAHDAIAVALA